jgi:predicted nucleotidyltransferase
MSQKEAIEIIRRYLVVLRQKGIPVEMAYLYGSYARGDAHEGSDIDVMLISSLYDTADDYELSKPWLFTTRVDPRLEPISVGRERFRNDDVSPLLEIVRREGIAIAPTE